MASTAYSVERLADRAAIYDVLVRWCRGVDRMDFDTLSELYHPDATEDHVVFKGDVRSYIASLRERQQHIDFITHFLGNMLVEFTGPDQALVETYSFGIMRFKAGAPLPPLANLPASRSDHRTDLAGHSRYIDRFERRNGEWRIARRVTVIDWAARMDVPPGSVGPGVGWVIGRRDRSDPLWAERAAVGLTD